MLRSLRLRSLSLLLLACVVPVATASAAVQNRISTSVSNASHVAIPNSVPGRARAATDLGAAAGDMKLEAMTLRFSMTEAQQSALDQLLAAQQNPASSQYRQWLTPAQYATQFGLSAADIAKVTAWLTTQGFTNIEVANSATFVRFNGTVAQAQTAFATSIHTLSANGETHFSNVTDAAVPAALSGVVGAITGLHDFRLKSRVRTHVVNANTVRPEFTSSISGGHFIAPGDFYTIYNESPLFTSGTNGTGVIVAVMGQVDINLTDIAAFRAAAGLAANVPVVKTIGTDPGGPVCSTNCSPNSGDLAESSLDVEWSGATAPNATILFVNSKDVIGLSLTGAIDSNLAPIISISYGDCESAWGTSELNTLNQLIKQANAQGITVIAPAGDSGATDCDSSVASAVDGLAVDFPASSPYATALGGTMFNEGNATGATTYWNSNSASGTANAGSALSYIPEAVWNEDVSGSTFAGGGGGVSNFFTKPAWQVGSGVPADASRDVPDISLNAAASHDGYLYCVSSSCVNGTFRASDGQSLTEGGGTSFAVPTFAGILALVEQHIGARVGNANPMIYALANSPAYYNANTTSAFHDVTAGNNSNPCTAGTPNCPSGGTIGYAATTGYDLATGWGTINAYNFVNAWGAIPALAAGSPGPDISTTVVTASSTSVVSGTTVTLTASLSGNIPTLTNGVLTLTQGPTPTGAVQFLINNVVTGTPVTLVNGQATAPFVTGCSTLGQQVITASYSGDTNYAGSKGAGITSGGSSTVTPLILQVSTGTCPDFTVTPASTIATVTTGTPSVVITVAPLNNFTGTVVFTASAVENSGVAPSLVFSPSSVSITSSASATTTLTLAGITAALHLPAAPGSVDRGTLLAGQSSPHRIHWYGAGSGATLACLLLIALPRRRRLGGLLLVALSIALIGGATGCSSTKNSTIPAGTTTSDTGTYLVTIVGTYTSTSGTVTSHSTAVTFSVQ